MSSIEFLDLSSFNLENLKKSIGMFANCHNLKEIIFNNNTLTKNLETMELMFSNCQSLEYINTKIFRENKLTNLNDVFHLVLLLKKLIYQILKQNI